MTISKEERLRILRKFYLGSKRLQVDPDVTVTRRKDGVLFHVGQLVRYTDDSIDLANSVGNKNSVYDKIYKKTWQKRFMTIIGFDTDDSDVVLVATINETGNTDTHVCHIDSIQIVTESEKILYEK